MGNGRKYEKVEVNKSIFLDKMLENSQIACILILDKNGTVLDISRGVERTFGYTSEDVIGRSFSLFYTEEDQQTNKPMIELQEAMEKGSGLDNNFLVHKDGGHIWSQGESIRVKDEEGEIFFIKYVYDINKQKLLENFLFDSKKFSESILETINDPLIVLNEDFNILMANECFYKDFDIKVDLGSKNFFEISDESWNIGRLKELLKEILPKNSSIKDFEVEFNFSTGKRIYSLNAQQIIQGGEKQQKILIVFNDVTNQRQERNRLNLTNEELAKVNKDLDVFIYTASHDLKAPINNIEGLLNVIAQDPECSKRVSDLIEMMQESVHKFKETIDDLSTITRVEKQGREELNSLEFQEIFEEIKFNSQGDIEEAKATISADFSKAPTIYFSKKNLRSVLFNLLSNAIKYRSPERRPEIKFSTEKVEGYILLKVSDNGLGIKPEDKEKVMTIFERLHRHVEGTGVGMSIVKRIIDNNGGKIEIDSEVGKGSTFNIYFKV